VPDDDALVIDVLQKMVKQRRDRSRSMNRAAAPNSPTPNAANWP
jgi:uncharacterized protein YqeY